MDGGRRRKKMAGIKWPQSKKVFFFFVSIVRCKSPEQETVNARESWGVFPALFVLDVASSGQSQRKHTLALAPNSTRPKAAANSV